MLNEIAYLDMTQWEGGNIDLSHAKIHDIDLTGATTGIIYLTGATIGYIDLSDATTGDIYLTGAKIGGIDFHVKKMGLIIDSVAPIIRDLDQRILNKIETGGTLDMYNWHSCKTTHCRAGWAVVVAGKKGRELERRLGTAGAAAVLYSVGGLAVPDFYQLNNNAVMADIRRTAKQNNFEQE